WFAGNRVAANLLMILILAGGTVTAFTLRQEVFPEMSSEMVQVTVPYPGAAPAEVEDGVVTRIEEAIQGIEGIKEITATASEGAGTVRAELLEGADMQRVVSDVKSQVDAIESFPEEAEEPIVQELVIRRQVINVAVSGAVGERTLKEIGRRVRDDLAALPQISQVELAAARPYEVSIEVPERTLRRYGLTLEGVAQAVRRASIDLPGGSVRTEGGEILLRTEGQAYRGEEFERLPLITRPDGSRLLLGEVATVVDGFAETDQSARFDGAPGVLVQVFRVGDQDAIEVADAVKAYVEERRAALPPGVELTLWQDDTELLKSRRDLLVENGLLGLALVLVVLALFLRLRLAGWVALGILISFLGAIWLMPTLDVTVNMISLFAFIVVLGIVVDDAIVVGENIYTHYQAGAEGLRAALGGIHEMAVPVTFAVLTTVAAFSPLLAVPGNTGKIMRVIPLIVIPVLAFSLVEALLILPAHLSHLHHGDEERSRSRMGRGWRRFQDGIASRLDRFIRRVYAPSLEWALEWRYLTLATGVATLVLVGGLVAGGWIRFTFLPSVESDNVVAMLTMPQGTPAERTAAAVERLEETARAVERRIEDETGEPVFRHVLASVGQQPFRTQQSQTMGGVGATFSGAHLGEVNVELVGAEERDVDSETLADLWRRETGAVADAVELTFTASLFSVGDDVDVQLAGADLERLQAAAEDVKAALRRYAGVSDVSDSFRAGKQELELEITDEAQALGLTLGDLARQVRSAFFGAEAQRIQRGAEEVRVMVRFPESERRSLGDLEELRVRAPGGIEVPLPTAARAELGRGFASIQRVDRQRTVNVTADVDDAVTGANEVLAALARDVLPQVTSDHPGVRWSFEGEQEEQRRTLGGLARGFAVALLVIYILLAVPFRSYTQPLLIMSAIPFGLVGAVLGHLLMGIDLTILSGFGAVALTGVVVNNGLVMVDFINRKFRGGLPLERAIRDSGMVRFRPILLTSLTTFAGLSPLLAEQSLQAQFLIPMAVSLAFGVLFATAISLILVPVLYGIYQDAKVAVARAFGKEDEVRPALGGGEGEEGEPQPAG
ncbi:MAG: efflux RND transporter permease subunit, partial [Thermoanaerobaculia bacterium]